VPFRVIGVAGRSGNVLVGTNLNAWIPYSTALSRMLGQSHVSSITVRVSDITPMHVAEEAITSLLSLQHGRKDFFVQSTAQVREAIETTTKTMNWFVGSVAAISLLVGGIGVMNIMLVSVSERTWEIGVRIAVGARQSDILKQFLIEAVLVCLLGGGLGIFLALGLGLLCNYLADDEVPMMFSGGCMLAAFACSTSIGIIFGFWPAWSAARLDPARALAKG
jgi:macrolide transport system ATP-binding/permease protein